NHIPRYNIAPTQDIAVVRLDQGHKHRELSLLRWGLIPSWAKDPKIGNRMINARAETLAEKPSFRVAFRKRRCLVLADGFFEWQKVEGAKRPHFIHRQDDAPFAFAGLWDHWQQDGKEIQSCTIITTTANSLMEPLHNRMPVILSEETFPIWLDPEFQNRNALQDLLRPCNADLLEAYPVSTQVNNARNDVPECVNRVKI
ncbi:MAG: SOS response-associated peptidase, partial [Planctomycetaceae bacterium]|nr:SOS response-associated peptidase [Planctomycetaceae bacterium]